MSKINNDILIAGAIGDALGYLVEFKSLDEIQKIFGKNGVNIDNYLSKKLIVSDDTQMTLFCYHALIKEIKSQTYINNDDLDKLNNKIYVQYIDWFITQGFSGVPKNNENKLLRFQELYYRRAPGMTCLSALSSKVKGTINNNINNSKGCGTVMRTAPISFLNTSLDNIFSLGAMQGALTHGHKEGYLSSGFFSVLLKEIINKKPIDLAFGNSINILKVQKDSKFLVKYLEKIFTIYKEGVLYKGEDLNTFIGKGNTAEEAVGVAMYSFLIGKSLKEVLDIAINHSGDSDSTAILVAQLYVAKNGLDDKYRSMIKNIDIKKVFDFLNIS